MKQKSLLIGLKTVNHKDEVMSVKIEMTENQRDLLKQYYQQRLLEIEKEVSEIREIIQQLKAPAPIFSNGGYDKNWSVFRKMIFILQNAGKPLTLPEIRKAAVNLEPDLDKRKFRDGVYTSLTVHSRDGGVLIKHKNHEDELFAYGLKENANFKWEY